MTTTLRRGLVALVTTTSTAALALSLAPSAGAQTPGAPGLLAVMRDEGPDHLPGVYTMNPDGSGQQLVWEDTFVRKPAFSPDGTRLAVTVRNDVDDTRLVYTASITGTDRRPVSPTTHRAFDVAWSPDGSELAYTTSTDDLYVIASDGSGEPRLLVDTDCMNDAAWGVDGHLYFTVCDQAAAHPDDVHRVLATGGPVALVADTPVTEVDVDVHPAGGLLVVATGGTSDSLDEPGGLWLMSTDGADPERVDGDRGRTRSPVFSPDGSQVAFVATDPAESPDERTRTHVLDLGSGAVRVVPSDLAEGQQEYNVAWQPLPTANPPAPGDLDTTVTGPETVSTGASATADAPLQTQIAVPAGVSGTLTVDAQPTTAAAPSGFALFGRQVVIEGPVGTAVAPYRVTFTLDVSLVGGVAPADVQVWRDGVALAACTGPTAAVPDPCLVSRTAAGDGDVAVTVRTSHFSTWTFGRLGYSVTGPFPPVDAQPTVNTVKAGSAVPVKFRLGGDRGLDVLVPGYPRVVSATCGTTTDAVEESVAASNSGLTYDAASQTYSYVWKTARTDTGCRELVLRFRDGSTLTATFRLR
ncbi:hypothetical protein GCU56_03920 [Geodermatophilus sabuli]|uniref:WD40-like Beta Propeller Repeat n=1 Tax=Geodermatophilus sabuli TaxID=1564158 RepID=A0A7K3VWJ8_9ACTN|nr:PxKF domain-containing protein [Geodermatophilus sabuli]NEK57019.1 hypothetical protein [Geodermatophilus sabuli]